MNTENGNPEVTERLAGSACVTRFDLAHLLRVSVRTVDRMIAAQEIRVRRVRGKAVRFMRSDVEQYLEGEKLKTEIRKVENRDGAQGLTRPTGGKTQPQKTGKK